MNSDSLLGTDNHNTSPISSLERYCRQLVSPAKKSPPEKIFSPVRRCSNSKDLHRVFTYFDENGDGMISTTELQSRLRIVGGHELSEEEAEMAVMSLDSDGDGVLGLEDFAQLMEAGKEEEKIVELREVFGMYSNTSETTGFGYITPKSLKRMLSRLEQSATDKECKAIIGRFDLNGDGVLDFDEFRTMMR